MNASTIIFIVTYIFIACLFIIQPWFSRKNVMFGVVFGDDTVWKEEKAKQIRHRYLLGSILASVVISLAAVLYAVISKSGEDGETIAFFCAINALLIIQTVAYVLAFRRTRAFKAGKMHNDDLVSDKIIVETGVAEKRAVISATWLLLLVPLFVATIAVTFLGYGNMSAIIPTHYNFVAADGWSQKSLNAVLSPVMIEIALVVIFAFCFLFTRRAPASVRGNPDAAPDSIRFRKHMSIFILVMGVIAELDFLTTVIGFITPVSPLLILIPSMIELLLTVIMFYIYFRFVRVKKPSGPILDDDAKWVLGLFYYNPSDPSIFVEKRVGIGYTTNFARPAAWIFTFGIIAFVVITIIFSSNAK